MRRTVLFLVFLVVVLPLGFENHFAEAQSLITGSTARNAHWVDATIPNYSLDLGKIIGKRAVTLHDVVTVDGRDNSVSLDVAGVAMTLGLDQGGGSLMADLKILHVGVENEGGGTQSAAVVQADLGGVEVEVKLYFDPGMSAITSSTALVDVPPTPYRIVLRDKASGREKAFAGVAGTSHKPSKSGEGAQVPLQLTSQNFTENDDLDAACRAEFGPESHLADWQDVKSAWAKYGRDLPDLLGLKGNALVQCNGQRFWHRPRHYFIARHDGRKPGNFLAHDQVGGYVISLGSWYHRNMPALCVVNR